MINNKKVILTYIVCFFLFLTLNIFPNFSNQPRLYVFQLKDNLEKPFNYLGLKFKHSFNLLKSNNELLIQIDNLKKENEFLKNINNYFQLLTSKYNDQYKVFHNNPLPIPSSVGVSVIGDRNLFQYHF